MKTTCYYCRQTCICCDRHGACEDCEYWAAWSCFAHAASIPLPRSSFLLRFLNQRGEISFELCALALLAFFAFHIGAFVARRGDSLITFILKAAGL